MFYVQVYIQGKAQPGGKAFPGTESHVVVRRYKNPARPSQSLFSSLAASAVLCIYKVEAPSIYSLCFYKERSLQPTGTKPPVRHADGAGSVAPWASAAKAQVWPTAGGRVWKGLVPAAGDGEAWMQQARSPHTRPDKGWESQPLPTSQDLLSLPGVVQQAAGREPGLGVAGPGILCV